MIPEWPHKSPYAEAAAQLQDAILVVKLRDAINGPKPQMRAASRADISNTHATNIRDDIAALTNEGARRVDAAFNAPNSEEGLS